MKLLTVLTLTVSLSAASQSVPTFTRSFTLNGSQSEYTAIGGDPSKGGTTSIPIVVVPVSLTFETRQGVKLDPAADVPKLLHSPIFANYRFGDENTQYIDALLRTSFSKTPSVASWHTLLAKPNVMPMQINVPAGYGYVLHDKGSMRTMSVVDVEWLQTQLFQKLPQQANLDGKLLLFVTKNTTYYADGDATVCCSWGTHGIDRTSKRSFVLASYLDLASLSQDADIQPITQQLAEFAMDPLHDPLFHGPRGSKAPGNTFAGWQREGARGGCGSFGVASQYFLLLPTNTNPKNNFPASPAFAAQVGATNYHLQNVPLLSWYAGTTSSEAKNDTYSFPDSKAITEPAKPCPVPSGANNFGRQGVPPPKTAPVANDKAPNGHQLIGYWNGGGTGANRFRLRDVAPQWDVIIIAFAVPARSGESEMIFRTPFQYTPEEFKSEVQEMQAKGKKVMISLGGGGQNFQMTTPEAKQIFIDSVTKIVEQYGFDGVDIDFEAPSIVTQPGDLDFRHPTSPGTVNLISALHTLHDHFGSKFMVTLVPEGTQTPGGYPSYGGQFGSYLPLIYGLRDILTFSETQDYNTPPLEALDGNVYQPGTVDYHAAVTELLLHGFPVGHNPKYMFPPVPARQIAVGFLNGDTNPQIVMQAMDYIITGKAPAGTKYKLLKPSGYPEMRGAMFWTIDADRRGEYNYSNTVGPQLHTYPSAK